MVGSCPNCDKLFDADGFWEHKSKEDGVPLYYCKCGTVFDENYEKVNANMKGLGDHNMDGYIKGSRLRTVSEKTKKRLLKELE